MKKLSIEEKARAYDKALKQIKECTPDENGFVAIYPQDIFPELKESGDDRIRKAIKKALQVKCDGSRIISDEPVTLEEAISWLEKQGEQKLPIEKLPSEMKSIGESLGFTTQEECDRYNEMVTNLIMSDDDKVEPKFRIGDFVKNTNYHGEPIYEIVYIDKECYICEYRGKENMGDKAVMHFSLDNPYLKLVEQKSTDEDKPKFKVRDWTVSNLDGKARQISEVHFDEYNSYYVVDGKSVNLEEYDRLHHLWTIQDAKDGDVLFMDNGAANCIFIYKSFNNGIINKYASYNNFGFEGEHYLVLNDGYVIPATKEQCDLLFQKMKEASYEWDAEKKELKKIEQKIADWSKEDERIYYSLLADVKTRQNSSTSTLEAYYNEQIEWLKSIKDRMQSQPKQEWSEKDEHAMYLLKDIVNHSNKINERIYTMPLKEKLYDFLKSLKDRALTNPKQEWSEEDERTIKRIDSLLYAINESDLEDIHAWLKSLRPQNTWKPSDEQIYWLKWAINRMPDTEKANEAEAVLKELLEELEKLL